MTKTQRHTGRHIRTMLRTERAMQAAEGTDWKTYGEIAPANRLAASQAHAGLVAQGSTWSAAWQRLLRVGR